jgi:hypothetical protein
MSKTSHRIFLGVLVLIVFGTLILLIYKGLSYYNLSLDERVYNPDHSLLKPSGTLGHGYGIIGSLSLIIGVFAYMARKRYRFLSRMGIVKHWLEFHIFLCTLGPVLVLFHTAYKFGGLVAISFWSMVAVFFSGVIGRFIYLQIPRSIEGRELNLNEIIGMKSDLADNLRANYNLDEKSFNVLSDSISMKSEIYHTNKFIRYIRRYADDRKSIHSVKKILKENRLTSSDYKKIIDLMKVSFRLNRRIEGLGTMQKMFRYWHVVHLPFAIIMLIIMLVHVGVTILFGYKWIF